MTKAEQVAIQLIVGLGNPGSEYAATRHNAGVWFIEELARCCGATLQAEKKFHGLTARISLHGRDIRLLSPTTFMNRSGLAVAAMARFYRISCEQILIAHDELDIPVGTVRLKQGGGHGGHNGLRDIINGLGQNRDFHRLRIGIGHPGHARLVSDYVLSRPSIEDNRRIREAVDQASRVMPELLNGSMAKAVQQLHTFIAK